MAMSLAIGFMVVLLTVYSNITAQKMKSTSTWEKSRMEKSLRPPEIILGLPYSSKVDVWVLGCTVGYVLFALDCHLISRFFEDISFVDWKATRPRGERRR